MKKKKRKKAVMSANKFDISPSIFEEYNIEQAAEELITIESIRACKDYENLSDEQIADIVHTLKTYAEIVVATYIKNLQNDA